MNNKMTILCAPLLLGCYDANSPTSCIGVLDFSKVTAEDLRRDAFQTTLQFVELDTDVELAAVRDDAIWIQGVGESCNAFGRSFTGGTMEEFRDVTYEAGRGPNAVSKDGSAPRTAPTRSPTAPPASPTAPTDR